MPQVVCLLYTRRRFSTEFAPIVQGNGSRGEQLGCCDTSFPVVFLEFDSENRG